MKNDVLGKFLNGDAHDDEFIRCETMLEDARTIVDEGALDKTDPLVSSLRVAGAAPTDEDERNLQIVQRIAGAIAQQVISQDQIARLLDAPQQADELGRIGRYRVIEFIAAGGMGLVFKAEDSHLNRLVCIKIMHPSLALKPEARLRFERESRAAAQLRSERIVTLLDIGVQRDLPYIVMQLLDGESLRSKLSREGKLSSEESVEYLLQIAEGLRHAHSMGILHRDIKPDNIWIMPSGDIKLLDFGLARPFEDSGNLTTTGGLVGTPQYMSPEQVQGQTLDARSDLFSLGIVLFEMLTGMLPFQKNNLFSTMIAITNDSVSLPAIERPSEIVRNVEGILHQLLKKNANERIQSAQELMDQLSRAGSRAIDRQSKSNYDGTLPLASAGRGNTNQWRYVLGGVFGGLLAMLLILLVMQTTNKGTLLVRANDPQVDIRIAEEKVHVKDPLTGKSFEIQVGKTRLPGGVYQLEMNDVTSGLTFSSNTIIIRRGETVIIEVELQPAAQVAGNDQTNSSSDVDSKPQTPSADSIANAKNADPSFQPKARDDFARTLANLPAQSINFVAAKSSGDAGTSLHAEQATLEGIDYWSIDTDTFVDSGVVFNCDKTLLGTVRGNTAQIWDQSLKLKYTLHSTQAIWELHFDNKYPNLIAASTFVGDWNESKPTMEDSYEITVWRLGSDYAEIIYRVPCRRSEFAWDQGYRLFHQGREGLAAFRLDENKKYELHVPHEDMLANAISNSGRFLATRNGSNIDVWDLHRGEFAFTSLDNSRVQWDQQGERAAFFSRSRSAFEIWDLEKRAIDSRVELPGGESVQARTYRTGLKKPVIELEPTFQRVAWLTPQGKLSLRNLRNNREHSQNLPDLGKAELQAASLRWAGSSLIVEADKAAYVWTHDKSDVEGTLKEGTLSALMARKQGVPLKISHAVGATTPVLLWQDVVAVERNMSRVTNTRDRQPEMYFDAFDIASNRWLHQSPFSQLRIASYSGQFGNYAVELLGPPYVSRDGRYATASSSDAFGSGKVILKFADAKATQLELPGNTPYGGLTNTFWDKGSRFAVVGTYRKDLANSTEQILQIYDAQTNQIVDQTNAKLPAGSIVDIQPSGNGFVVILRLAAPPKPPAIGRQPVPPKYAGELEVRRVDPLAAQNTKAEVATKLLAKIGLAESITVTDRYLFVCTFEEQGNSDVKPKVRKYYRIALDEEIDSRVECVTLPEVDELFFDSTGEHIIRHARDAEVVRSNDPLTTPTFQYRTKGLSTLFHARWSDIAHDHGNLDQFAKPSATENDWWTVSEFTHTQVLGLFNDPPRIQWHPMFEVAAWISNGTPNFFKSTDNSVRRIHFWTGGQLMATDKGWIRGENNEVQFFELSGKPIGKLMFDPYLDNSKPTRPRWQLVDGALATQSGTDGLAISFQQGQRFYCESIDDFERTRPSIKLPRTDVINKFE